MAVISGSPMLVQICLRAMLPPMCVEGIGMLAICTLIWCILTEHPLFIPILISLTFLIPWIELCIGYNLRRWHKSGKPLLTYVQQNKIKRQKTGEEKPPLFFIRTLRRILDGKAAYTHFS